MKVLNLYAGVGGNRKLWEDVEVTAVEIDPDIAKVYQDYFPDDNVIIGDAHNYLLNHYKEFDFIWSSPPCQTHSKMNRAIVSNGQRSALYPDMKLYQEILFLQTWCKCKWVVENVVPIYKPLIPTIEIERHLFWSNFRIISFKLGVKRPSIDNDVTSVFENAFGFDLSSYSFKNSRKDQVIRNCVHPETDLHILDCAREIIRKSNTKQTVIEF